MADSIKLSSRQIRSVYLITYSQRDIIKFPTRRSFATAVITAYSDQSKMQRWVCCREDCSDVGLHYHVAMKLDRIRRLISIKNELHNVHGIAANFSSHHETIIAHGSM